MNLGELEDAFRSDVDDIVTPYLWSRADFERYLNEAERQACLRARLLKDGTTAELCKLTVSVDKSLYELDTRIIEVKRAKLANEDVPLSQIGYAELDDKTAGWEDLTGTPTHFITDWQEGYLRLYKIPTAADSLWLTVDRYPLQDMTDDYDEPEIGFQYHEDLLHWVKYRAYLKKDPETLNEQEAAKHLALFEARFGYLPDANVRRKQRNKKPHTVKSSW